MTTKRLRSDDDIMLIGVMDHQITGAKLPGRKQVLQVLFYNLRIVGLNLRESSRLVVAEVSTFWQKARIPTHHEKHCIEKLEKLYNKWRDITKHHGRKTECQNRKETEFQDKLDDLFDIAHANAFELIKIQEDKEFLKKQREKGRPGCMLGTDKIVMQKEKRKTIQKEQENQRRIKEDERKELYEQQIQRGIQLYILSFKQIRIIFVKQV